MAVSGIQTHRDQNDGPTSSSATRWGDLLSGGAGDDSCLSAFDGQDDDSVLGGDGEDTFNADDGDFVSTVENCPTPCEGG